MGKFGTLSVLEDLAMVGDPVTGNETVLAQRFADALAIHNALFQDMVGDLATVVTQPQLPYLSGDTAVMQELDEWGRADASKATAVGNLGFPLRIYGSSIQWTATYFERATVSELAAQLDAHAAADLQNFRAQLKATLFKNTNTTGYVDRLASKLTYTLRALLNADGTTIPNSPSGTSFDGSTHTHYLASATYTLAAVQALIDTVVEHGVDGKIVLYIARADEATVRALTGFAAYLDQRITVSGSNQIGNAALDITSPDDRAIGVLGGAEVWVKPWIPQNYAAVLDLGSAAKPVGIRVRSGTLAAGPGSFRMVDEHGHYPLHAQNLGREFGMAAYARESAAVSRMNNATYVAP